MRCLYMGNLNYKEIGKRIQAKRKEIQITQEKLSEIIDVSPSQISEIERGSNASSTFTEILKNIPEKNHKLYISLCENIANTLK